MPDKYKLSRAPLTLMSSVQTAGKTETPLRHSEWKNTKNIFFDWIQNTGNEFYRFLQLDDLSGEEKACDAGSQFIKLNSESRLLAIYLLSSRLFFTYLSKFDWLGFDCNFSAETFRFRPYFWRVNRSCSFADREDLSSFRRRMILMRQNFCNVDVQQLYCMYVHLISLGIVPLHHHHPLSKKGTL